MKAPNFFVFSLLVALIFGVFQKHLQAMEEKEEVVLESDVKMMTEEPLQDISSLREEVRLLKEQLSEAFENINGLKRDFYKERIESLDFEIKKLFEYIKDLEKPELTFREMYYDVLKKFQEDSNHLEWKKFSKWHEILASLDAQMIGRMLAVTQIGPMKAIIHNVRSSPSESEKSEPKKSDLKGEMYRQLMEGSFKKDMPNYCAAHEHLCVFLRETIDRKMIMYNLLYGAPHFLLKYLN
jgi:hypothetical protein